MLEFGVSVNCLVFVAICCLFVLVYKKCVGLLIMLEYLV